MLTGKRWVGMAVVALIGCADEPLPTGRTDAQVAPDGDFYGTIYDSPFVDTYLGRFVAALVEGEALGKLGPVGVPEPIEHRPSRAQGAKVVTRACE